MAIKYKWYSEITVESETQLKTVYLHLQCSGFVANTLLLITLITNSEQPQKNIEFLTLKLMCKGMHHG